MLDRSTRGAGYGFSEGGVDPDVEIFATPKGVIESVGVGGVVVGLSHGGCGGGDIVRGGCHCLRRDLGVGGGKLLILMGLGVEITITTR